MEFKILLLSYLQVTSKGQEQAL